MGCFPFNSLIIFDTYNFHMIFILDCSIVCGIWDCNSSMKLMGYKISSSHCSSTNKLLAGRILSVYPSWVFYFSNKFRINFHCRTFQNSHKKVFVRDLSAWSSLKSRFQINWTRKQCSFSWLLHNIIFQPNAKVLEKTRSL